VSQAYKNAISNQNQKMEFVGGSNSDSIPDWETTVQASPAPIQVSLEPLWNLPQLALPGSGVTAQQLQWLQAGIIAYLESPNYYLSESILNYGDTVVLQPVQRTDPDRSESTVSARHPAANAPQTGVQSTISAPYGVSQLIDLYPGGTQLDESHDNLTPATGQPSPFELVLVNPANPAILPWSTTTIPCALRFEVRRRSCCWIPKAGGPMNLGLVGISSKCRHGGNDAVADLPFVCAHTAGSGHPAGLWFTGARAEPADRARRGCLSWRCH